MRNKTTEFDQIAYQNEYNKENYDRVTVMLPKGRKEQLREHAKEKGLSLNALISELIKKEMHW